LAAFTDKAESLGGLPHSPDFDVDTAKKLMLDPKALYLTKVVEGTSDGRQAPMYEMTVTGEEGTVKFQMTPEDKRSMMGSMFDAPSQVAAIRPYQEQIRKMGGYTTNLAGGKTNPNTAFLSKIDFPSVNIYGIKGDIIEPSKGQYAIKVTVYDPIKGKWTDAFSPMGSQVISETGIDAHLKGLNDAVIYQLINGTTPTAQELKELEELSKMRQ